MIRSAMSSALAARNAPRLTASAPGVVVPMIARGMAKGPPKPIKAGKGKKMRKPPPPKFRKVCRYVFPYPKCIDLMSLCPEPYCIETGGACRSGSNFLLLAGLVLTAISAYLSITTAINGIWYNFDGDDECCVEEDDE